MPADECAFCQRPGWQTELRLTAANELICHDCHDDGQACEDDGCSWLQLMTPDELMASIDAGVVDLMRRAGL